MSLICPIKEILLNLLNSFLGGKGNKRLVFAIISIVVFTVFGIETFLASKVQAATGVRHVINFQGKVVNSNGTNVADGLYRFQFKIYTVSSGGAAVWTEDWDSGNKIQVTGGIFQAQLGTVTTLPGSIDFNTDNIYLGVTFHTDGEMTPRVQFATVPQAFNAEKVNGLTVTNTSDLPFSSTTILKIASGKTVVVNAGLTFSGTDTTTFTFPSTGGNVVTEDFAQTLTNKTIGSTGLTFSGASTDVTTVSNEDFTFAPNGSGDLILTSDFDSGVSIGSVNSNPAPLSVTGGIGNNAALIVNQLNSGNLFAASAAGVTKFEITSTGAITSQAYTNTGGIVYTTSTGLLSQTAGGTNGNCLTYTGGLPAWGACSGDGLWRSFQGAVSPVNDSFDLLVGSNATTSAKFAIIGVNNARGLQTASISGNLVMDAAGSLQTTLNQTLTIGGDTSGDLLLKSNNVFVLRAPGTANIFVGSNAGVAGLSGTNNVVLGGTAGNALAAGSRNTFIGDGAGQSNNGSDNTFVGRITGNAAGAGTNNAFFGTSTGTNNLGGSYNTFIGYGAGNVNTEGLYNTIVGTSADLVGNSLTNANAFGTQAIVAASNSLVLGGTGLYAVNVGIGTTIPLSALHVNGGNNGGRAAVIFNQTGVSSNDIFAASSSGTTKFVIKNDGTASTSASFVIDGSGALQATRNQTLTLGGGTTGSINISPLNGSGILNLNLASSNGLKINGTSGSTLASSNLCISDVTNGIVVGTTTCESGGSSNWVLSSSFGTLSPINNTLDLLWGGTATQSAKFAVLGIDGTNTPVASVSATTGANANKGIYISGDGSIQSVRNNNLVLGGNTTGNIQFRPLNSTGLVTLIHGDSGTGGLQLQTNETDATTKNARIKMGHFTNLEEPISILVGNNNGIDNNLFFGGGSGTENSATDIHLMTGATNTTLTGTTRMHISRQGNIGIGDSQYNAPSKLFVMGTYGVSPLAIFSETGTNDIFIASSGGTTKFTLKNDGTASTSASFVIDGSGALQATRNQTLTLGGDSTGNIVFKPGNSSASLSLSSNGAIGVNGSYGVSGQCLITSGSSAAPNWAGCSSGSSSNWLTLQSAQGTLYPVNTTLDMLWGGTATESATFRLTGNTAVAGTTSVASISANTSFAAFVIDQRGSGDFFTASSSGLTKFTITKEGGILASSGLTINKLGSLDIVKSTSGNNQVDSDFERTANGTPATLTNLDNSGGEISLSSGTVSGDGTITTGSQPVLPGAAGAGGHSILAQNGKYLVVRGGATTLYVYDSLANSFTTSSQVLNAAAGAGAMSLPRADGRYLVLHGGGATTNSIVDPTGTMAVGGSVASGAMNTGTNAFRRQNGRYLILRGGAAATQLWDPSAAATSFVTGPNPTGTIGAGSLVLARQNGTALVVIGGASAVTNVYNPFNGTITSTVPIGSFEVGPSLPTNCEINGAGSVALQKADGRYIILSKAGVSVEYDPATNTMGPCQAVGPAAALADGAHAIRLQDRRFLIFRGSGTTNAYIYDPATNTYSTHATSTSTQGAGAHSLQKADGTWMLVAGGSTTTNKYDSQLVMNGTYT